jgi:hypothetical protein
VEDLGRVLAAAIGVHDHPGDRVAAAADRDGHRQCGVGEFGVVILDIANPTMRRTRQPASRRRR